MKYDFDKPTERRGTCSYKWDIAPDSDIIPLWVADMDFEAAPAIQNAIMQRVEHGVYGYVKVPENFYEASIRWFAKRHGWHFKREWMTYTIGVVPAISAIIKAFTKPGDKMIAQTPDYNCFFSSIRNNGCEIVENPLKRVADTYVMDYADLEEKAKDPKAKMLILCNPHNPAGRVWKKDELTRLAQICIKHNVIIVSDDIHCELVMPGNCYTPLPSLSEEFQHQCISCISPSKSFNIAGLQIANIVTDNPEWLAKIDKAININEVCDVNPFGVVALMAAYNDSGDWIDQLCQYLYGNYTLLRKFFSKHFPQFPVIKLEGTYLAWIDIKASGMSSDDFTQLLLEKAHVWVNSGTMYGANEGEGFIRINLATQRTKLHEALRRMAKVL